MTHKQLKISIISDYFMFRQGLTMMLPANEGFFTLQSQYCNPYCIDHVKKTPPDVLVYDFHSCPHKTLDSMMILESLCSYTKVVVIISAQWQRMFKGIRIYGYHDVADGVEVLKDLLYKVAADAQKYSKETRRIKGGGLAAYSSLTKRELEVVRHVSMGKTSREIASALHIAVKTVEVHRHNILSKLGISKSNKLVNYMTDNAFFVNNYLQEI